jgi:hypothetical protein
MKCYLLVEKDQPKSSWVLLELVKAAPKRTRSPALPPVMFSFFGPQPDGEMRMKPRYAKVCCKGCGKYDDDDVYRVGFDGSATIRIQGDFAHTQDRVFVISDKFLRVLKEAKVRGYETKPIGATGWHAVNVTERVDAAKGVLKPAKSKCRVCKRNDGTVGAFAHERHLSLPSKSNTLFTTKTNWHQRFQDRDIFLTEDVKEALKGGGIKGGWCNRLWSDEEVKTAEEKAKNGVKWKPAGWCVTLSGK